MSYIGPGIAIGQGLLWNGTNWYSGNITTTIVDGLGALAQAIPVQKRIFGLIVYGNNTGSAPLNNNGWSSSFIAGGNSALAFTRNDIFLQKPWTGVQSLAAANSNALAANQSAVSHTTWLSTTASCGGFYLTGAMGTGTGATAPVANQSSFVGYRNLVTSPAGGTNASTFVDMVGVGWDTGDANLQVMCNDGAGVATKVDLGSNFLITSKMGCYYEFFCAPGSTTITYRITALPGTAGGVTNGTFSTNTPTINQDITWQAYCTNGATAAIAAIYWGSQYCEAF